MSKYEISTDITVIASEINAFKQIAGQSIWEIGKRLRFVKENDLAHGQFLEWLKTVNMDEREAQRYMKVSKELPNTDTWSHLGARALYLIATLPIEERTKKHETASGDLKAPNEMTVKEIESLKASIKEKDAQIKNLADVIDDLSNVEPNTVFPEDYQKLKDMESEMKNLVNQQNSNKEDAMKYQELKKGIAELQGQMSVEQKRFVAMQETSKFFKQGNELLDVLAPSIYSHIYKEVAQDSLVNKKLDDLVNRVEDWCDDMRSIMKQNNFMEGEIVDE